MGRRARGKLARRNIGRRGPGAPRLADVNRALGAGKRPRRPMTAKQVRKELPGGSPSRFREIRMENVLP